MLSGSLLALDLRSPHAVLALWAVMATALLLGMVHGVTPDEHTWPIAGTALFTLTSKEAWASERLRTGRPTAATTAANRTSSTRGRRCPRCMDLSPGGVSVHSL